MDNQDDFDYSVDFTFMVIKHELWALGEQLQVLEQQMPLLASQQRKNSLDDLRRRNLDDDEVEVEHARLMAFHFAEDVLPRLLRAPFLLSLWSVFESGINDIAKYIQQKKGCAKSPRDVRGENTLDGFQKYFDQDLRFPLFINDSAKDDLTNLLMLRNAFAHAGGQIDQVKLKDRPKIKRWAKTDKSIAIDGDWLVPSSSYVSGIYSTVDYLLRDLMQRTLTAFPSTLVSLEIQDHAHS